MSFDFGLWLAMSLAYGLYIIYGLCQKDCIQLTLIDSNLKNMTFSGNISHKSPPPAEKQLNLALTVVTSLQANSTIAATSTTLVLSFSKPSAIDNAFIFYILTITMWFLMMFYVTPRIIIFIERRRSKKNKSKKLNAINKAVASKATTRDVVEMAYGRLNATLPVVVVVGEQKEVLPEG